MLSDNSELTYHISYKTHTVNNEERNEKIVPCPNNKHKYVGLGPIDCGRATLMYAAEDLDQYSYQVQRNA